MVSAPIKTDNGYYLVMLTPLDETIIQADLATQERLRQELLAEKRRKRFDEVIADIRTNASVRFAEASRYITEDTGSR
jgi:peptidyl-prolyl cis-trans isomerase C